MSFRTSGGRGDTRLLAWRKVLGQLQNQTGALTANNPNPNDGLRRVLVKVLNALRGTSGEHGGTGVGSVVLASGAGSAAINQRFSKQADGSWLSNDGLYTILFVTVDNKWEIFNAFAVVFYASDNFPLGSWSVQSGTGPAPTFAYA